jgi:hypothetical protein
MFASIMENRLQTLCSSAALTQEAAAISMRPLLPAGWASRVSRALSIRDVGGDHWRDKTRGKTCLIDCDRENSWV